MYIGTSTGKFDELVRAGRVIAPGELQLCTVWTSSRYRQGHFLHSVKRSADKKVEVRNDLENDRQLFGFDNVPEKGRGGIS
jgi:hypothetical protein